MSKVSQFCYSVNGTLKTSAILEIAIKIFLMIISFNASR